MRSRFLKVVALAASLFLVALIALHTPPVRNAARARAEGWLRDRLGIQARIGSLDYNLTTLRVEIRDLTLAPTWRPDPPFLHRAA